MHHLRPVLERTLYDIEQYIPSHLIKRIEELESIAFPIGYK